MTYQKIFVTGGAGYIGSHTCVVLLQNGYDVCVFDNLSNSHEDKIKKIAEIGGKKIEFFKGDILDKSELEIAMRSYRPDAVIHFAGLKSVSESIVNPSRYFEVNLTGGLNVLNVMSLVDCNQIVFSSSATVYSKLAMPPYSEESDVLPSSPYGRSKLYFESILKDWSQSATNRKAVVLRYFNPVGAHGSGLIGEDPKLKPSNLMPIIAEVSAGIRSNLTVFGNDYNTRDGTGERDYIHVMDVASGHVRVVDKLQGLSTFDVFNLGTGKGTTVLELVQEFQRCSGREIQMKIGSRRPGDVSCSIADASKAKKILQFECKMDLHAMCFDTLRWKSKQ